MELQITSGELRMLGALKVLPVLFDQLIKKKWYTNLTVYFRDIAESFYENKQNGEGFLSILEKKIKNAEESVREEYYRILSMIPTIKNENSAEEIFKEYIKIFDIKYSKGTKVRKLLALAQVVEEMTTPVTPKEHERLTKKAEAIKKKAAKEREKLLVKPKYDNVI